MNATVTVLRIALLLTLCATSACRLQRTDATPAPAPAPSAVCRDGELPMQRSTLYFGAAVPNSTDTVDSSEWQAFLDASVTPRFPDGLTWFDARGQWRGADGQTIGEPSRVLILLHADDATAATAIDAIRSDYKTAFKQEAVLRERAPTCAAF